MPHDAHRNGDELVVSRWDLAVEVLKHSGAARTGTVHVEHISINTRGRIESAGSFAFPDVHVQVSNTPNACKEQTTGQHGDYVDLEVHLPRQVESRRK